MKILGIDYGSKRTGIAMADTKTGMAFPKEVLKSDANMLYTINLLCQKEGIEKIVLGESKDLGGKDNAIAKEIAIFKTNLESQTGVAVVYEPEFYSSAQAARVQGENDMIDASAAAIILQSYLDKHGE